MGGDLDQCAVHVQHPPKPLRMALTPRCCWQAKFGLAYDAVGWTSVHLHVHATDLNAHPPNVPVGMRFPTQFILNGRRFIAQRNPDAALWVSIGLVQFEFRRTPGHGALALDECEAPVRWRNQATWFLFDATGTIPEEQTEVGPPRKQHGAEQGGKAVHRVNEGGDQHHGRTEQEGPNHQRSTALRQDGHAAASRTVPRVVAVVPGGRGLLLGRFVVVFLAVVFCGGTLVVRTFAFSLG